MVIYNGMTQIGHLESSWTTLVRKDWKQGGTAKNGHFKTFQTTLFGKDWEKC